MLFNNIIYTSSIYYFWSTNYRIRRSIYTGKYSFFLFRSLINLVVNQETTSLRHNIQINKRKHILINMDIKYNNKNITMHLYLKFEKQKYLFTLFTTINRN